MVKQFKLPLYVIWIFAGIAFVAIGLFSVIHWTYGVGTLILSLLVAYIGYRYFFRPAFVAMEIARSGEPAMAVILDIWDTGRTVEHNPRKGMKLEIRHSTMVPYEVEIRQNVPKGSEDQFRIGRIVEVKIDARNPKKVVILSA